MPVRLAMFLVGLVLLLGALVVAGVQVVLLERGELEEVTPFRPLTALAGAPGSTRISARLAEVELEAGEQSLFELCAQAPLRGAAFSSLTAVAWIPGSAQVELKVPLDAEHLALAKHAGGQSCLTLGGGKVERAGRYALDLVWAGGTVGEAVRAIPLRARILARRPLGAREGLLVIVAALGAMLMVLSGFVVQEHTEPPATRRAPWLALTGTVLAIALGALVLRLPIPGSIGGLLRGVGLALVECTVAFVFAWYLYRSPRAGLSLHAPERKAGLWLLVSALCAALLNPLARLAMELVPASGEAPIEAFISWPSGALAFALLGMAVPLAEELFFRGFVFGALAPLGVASATVGTVLLFGAAHAQQAWGNWGALLSVLATGTLLTVLRATTGSTLVPAVAHLLYNLSLWKDSFRG